MFESFRFIENMRGAAFCLLAVHLDAGGLAESLENEKAGEKVKGRIMALKELNALFEPTLNLYSPLCQPKNGIVTPESVDAFIQGESALCKVIIAIFDAFDVKDFGAMNAIVARRRGVDFDALPRVEKEKIVFFDNLRAFMAAREILDFVDLKERAAK